ncbi:MULTISPECIES: MCE family protein [Prauserella salsuginis group]|uniref:Virulence factor Mce-like protein n=2 Tax=Prauserella salsuginis group TaxID=2893672 RepID=A0A839XKB2_9PSEU|nr:MULTISPECIES: MCE family protein [Prauserella salsuginis group]MBB3664362.1 virulence factor Mce-like protein [Prauserella sediminis]MCR3721813.1 virulence factor Mce family protein [Prauserella flava]MCR3734504.1 virulence factor Mce family protein [Prauserella salsuginis]
MTMDTRAGRSVYRWLATACVAVLLLTGGVWWLLREDAGIRLTAHFDRAVGLYAGSTVRVLGIEVGEITRVQPRGEQVVVSMRVDNGVQVPEGADAVVVAPSLVSDRYVQLTPVYDGGPVMTSGTVIPRDRTATPMEIDDLYASLDELSTALGPDGANSDGALSRVLDTTAANLDGNGRNLNTTVTKLSELATTLDDSSDDLFGTVRNLQKFTELLATSDAQLNRFYERLSEVSGFLAEDSDDVGKALSSLGGALGKVKGFVGENRKALSDNIGKLEGITQVLVDQRAAVAEIADVAPLGLSNFINSYDAASGSIAIRYNFNEVTNPLMTSACKLTKSLADHRTPEALDKLCEILGPVVDGAAKLPSVSQLLASIQSGELPPLPLPSIVAPGGR